MDVPHRPAHLRLQLVHELHRLEDAQRLADPNAIADLDERWRLGGWRPVECADHGGLHFVVGSLGRSRRQLARKRLTRDLYDPFAPGRSRRRGARAVLHDANRAAPAANLELVDLALFDQPDRSEERRVGKECRSWWGP